MIDLTPEQLEVLAFPAVAGFFLLSAILGAILGR
jgi:hypothetical protein